MYVIRPLSYCTFVVVHAAYKPRYIWRPFDRVWQTQRSYHLTRKALRWRDKMVRRLYIGRFNLAKCYRWNLFGASVPRTEIFMLTLRLNFFVTFKTLTTNFLIKTKWLFFFLTERFQEHAKASKTSNMHVWAGYLIKNKIQSCQFLYFILTLIMTLNLSRYHVHIYCLRNVSELFVSFERMQTDF